MSSAIEITSRLAIEALSNQGQSDPEEGEDVAAGLRQRPKTLPPKYFYDDRGSELFEQICALPEYYPTRTEAEILRTCAAEIAQATGSCELVELGSGSSTKTRLLLDAYLTLDAQLPFCYVPIDVSGGMLAQSARALLKEYETLKIRGLVGTYRQALQRLPQPILPQRLLFFLGSSLGNLAPDECREFMDDVRGALQLGDFFLLGLDLQKPVEILEAAYNDAQGVTAAFNLNMLNHLNRRFNGDFNPDQFQHNAFYNVELHQIEMHLRSRCNQVVSLLDLGLKFSLQAEETIRTEISRKFDLAKLSQILEGSDQTSGLGTLQPIQTWTDQNQWFGLVLCQLQ
ncbi:MAG: L-histidine N(alpha)-methyltransferase [Cyanobacteria bacterium P01_F01_bin.42]